MAQTGYTPIQIYYSTTTTNAPSAGNLLSGELAINITDGKMFYKDNGGSVQVIAWKTTPTTAGGTGLTSWTAGDLPYYSTGTTLTKLGIGTNGQVLTSTGTAPQWSTLSGVAVTTFSAGTTGFTPSTATSGAVTLAGTLATTNGGTGLTSFTANRVFYASSTSAIAQSANLTFDGTTLTANNFTDSSLTSGRVTYATTGGNLTDSANLLYSGTDLTVYGITVGRGAGAVSDNTAVGASALTANTTGARNSSFGWRSLYSNTTGTDNTALGTAALYTNTTGSTNTAIGRDSLPLNTTGSSNTAIGLEALRSNTTASFNTAVGYQAGYSNTTGQFNAALGGAALFSNTTASYNTAVGYGALTTNSTGANNTAHGFGALAFNTTASNNTAVGYQAGYSNTGAGGITTVGARAGYSATSASGLTVFGENAGYGITTGANNTGVGIDVLYATTTGANNVAIGTSALRFNTTASNNTAVGFQALYTATTSTDNVAVGLQAGFSATTGNGRGVYVGRGAGYSNTTGTDNVCIGYLAGYTNQTGLANVYIGGGYFGSELPAGYSATGSQNTFVGYAAGNIVTTGSKNTILGGYDGNQGGLDIRTLSNYIVLSDGDGNPRLVNNGSQTLLGAVSGVASGRLEVTGDTGNQYPALVGIGKGDITNQVGQQLVLIDSDNTNLRANFIIEDTGTRGGLLIQATEVSVSNDRDLYLAPAGGIITVGGVSPNTSGGAIQLQGATYGGITFPATQVASSNANTLDDYEEGTWTPTLLGSTTNPTTAVNGTGNYTKIGNVVTVDIAFIDKSTVGGVGGIVIGNLPFNISGVATTPPTGAVALYGFTLTGNGQWGWGETSTTMAIWQANSAGAWTRVDITAGTGKYLYLSLSYFTS